jgi:hypothetical protein
MVLAMFLCFCPCGCICIDILMEVNQKHGRVEEDKKRNAWDFFMNILG